MDGFLKLLREPYFVPESKPASELFHTFRKRKLSVALTVDEYGGVTGLVSMEDLLESIFGELPSASDVVAESEHLELPDGSSRLEGSMSVEQFNRQFGTHLDATLAETIGGVLLHESGELPPEGAKIELSSLQFEITSVYMNRVEEVTVRRITPVAHPTVPEFAELPELPESPGRPPDASSPAAADEGAVPTHASPEVEGKY